MNSLSSVVNVVVLIGIVLCFFISPLIYYFSFKSQKKIIMLNECRISDKDMAKLYVQFLRQK